MARIKAKPMNRLPMASVQIPNKPGFTPTPPPPVYDPNAVASGYTAATPQRYSYTTNGAPISQGTVAYGGQMHMFVSYNIYIQSKRIQRFDWFSHQLTDQSFHFIQ